MPPGGTLFRFFERFGENVPRSREASMPPLQQKRNVFENQQTPICRAALTRSVFCQLFSTVQLTTV